MVQGFRLWIVVKCLQRSTIDADFGDCRVGRCLLDMLPTILDVAVLESVSAMLCTNLLHGSLPGAD